ncbi:MAG: DUF3078 domain-containing protein [Paludibacter sp.]
MEFKYLIGIVFLIIGMNVNVSGQQLLPTDSIRITKQEVIDPDSLLNAAANETSQPTRPAPSKKTNKVVNTKVLIENFEKRVSENAVRYYKIPTEIVPVKIDSMLLECNPFFIELVFMGYPKNFKYDLKPDFHELYYGTKPVKLDENYIISPKYETAEQIITGLRAEARNEISRKAADVYIMSYDELPDPNGTKSHLIVGKPIKDIKFVDDDQLANAANRKMYVKKEQLGPWSKKANSLLQFSQNLASDNWYQGGTSTMSVLGLLTGQLNYDNKKNVQWENYGEWRMGFYSVFNDTTALRALNINDDIFKINSKLGIKAGGNFFYSGSVDFSTQFFKNYKSVSSTGLKSTFLTPVRLNIGMGLDYKYKKLFSLMVSPVAYKYIYIEETDPKKINPNMFGIKTGENHLSEIGSSFKAQCSYSPFRELQVDSRLNFYTNYEKVEIDWEIVGNFSINRHLSTRLSLNPRYDNTVILAKGDKAKIQFKELLSFGFSYKLLN